jgi:hypothetical protein
MAYSTSAPPVLVSGGGIGGTAPRLWTYTSTDAASAVDASGYITNGGELGMKVGDLVQVTDSDASPVIVTTHRVVTVSSTAPGAVDLSNGDTTVTGTNSD